MFSIASLLKTMRCPFGFRPVIITWCLLEVLFFSGFHNGWLWLQPVLVEEGYFHDGCANHTGPDQESQNVHYDVDMLRMMGFTQESDGSFSTMHEGRKVKCEYKKVWKEINIEDYKRLQEQNLVSGPDGGEDIQEEYSKCTEQFENLDFLYTLVILFQQFLCFPLGLLLDKYGNCRIRIVAMCCIVFGSLTMLFSSSVYPWMIFPALLMLGLSGVLILLTDLQVANLFGSRRYTVMSLFVGSYFSGGIVIFFMKLTKQSGVTLQTSFMFTTIGIVPVLISTIALLPRSRIPWPLPADYGQTRHVKYADDKTTKSKNGNRRISVGTKAKTNMSYFWSVVKTKLFIFCVVWFSLLSLKIWVFDISLEKRLAALGIHNTEEYVSLYAIILLLSLPLSPFFGIVLDWKRKVARQNHQVMQMRNILAAVCLHFFITVLSIVTSLFSNSVLQIVSYVLVAIEKVSLHASLFAFLTHVHFPSEHFGKLAGIALSASGLIMILQFPLKMLFQDSQKTFIIHIIFAVLVLISCCHPMCIWYHCRTGRIRNNVEYSSDKPATTVLLAPGTGASGDSCAKNRNTEDSMEDTIELCDTTTLQVTDL